MKLNVDLANVTIEQIDDIPCHDKDGNPVCNRDGEPYIHNDGTGYISEDLALLYPNGVYKGSVLNGVHVEGLLPDIKSTALSFGVPPLIIQCRLYHNGSAIKGTLVVNKKLPPKTIQVRPSMIKVKPAPTSDVYMVNSLELVSTRMDEGRLPH